MKVIRTHVIVMKDLKEPLVVIKLILVTIFPASMVCATKSVFWKPSALATKVGLVPLVTRRTHSAVLTK